MNRRARAREHATLVGYDPSVELATIDAMENPELTEVALTLINDSAMPDGVSGKAINLMLLNQPELALDNLEKAFAEGDAYDIYLKRQSIFKPLHDTPVSIPC